MRTESDFCAERNAGGPEGTERNNVTRSYLATPTIERSFQT